MGNGGLPVDRRDAIGRRVEPTSVTKSAAAPEEPAQEVSLTRLDLS